MLRAATVVVLFGLRTAWSACPVSERLPVKLFNDAVIGNDVLGPAKEEARWLLGSVCVEVEWVPCPLPTIAHHEPCGAPFPAIELHILPSPKTDDIPEAVMGIAFPTLGSRGNAGVFLSRVAQTVASNVGMISLPGLLGHVMAHEIGHLLLKSSAHSSEGLMRADFRPGDLKKAGQRQLKFSPSQSQAIHRNALARER
jgi:hypothetical protein